MWRRLFRWCIRTQIWLSNRFDRLFPEFFSVDGSADFTHALVPAFLTAHQRVYDVGGGKQPAISSRLKEQHALHVIGLDISQEELHHAPPGNYDETIVADIMTYHGKGDGDLVICNAVLEHVPDVESALQGIASLLQPGGMALVFVPSRSAIYARLNLLLPESLKKWLLYTLFPHTRNYQGFKSFYHRCTPNEFRQSALRCGFQVIEQRAYFLSGYFSWCFPLYGIWRLWVVCFYMIAREQAAESFSMILTKREAP